MSEVLNLEELAENLEKSDEGASNKIENETNDKNADRTTEKLTQKATNSQSAKQDDPDSLENLINETKTLLKLPFNVAMQNLKVTEEEVIEAAKELFTKGEYEKKIKLPFDSFMVLTSKRAMDELDYYHFLYSALNKNLSLNEFKFMMSVRQLAQVIVQHNDVDLRKKSIDERYEYLMNLPSPVLATMANASQKFWSILLLLMHKDLMGFLERKTLQ